MPCCGLAASEYLQPAPSRAQRWRLLGIARPDRLRSLAGGTGRNLRHRPGGAPGATGHRRPGPPAARSALNPAKLWWAGSTRPGATCGRCTAGWPPLEAQHRRTARRSPSPQLEIGPAGMEPGPKPGDCPTTGWRSAASFHGDPRRFPLLGGTRRQAPGRGLGGIATGV